VDRVALIDGISTQLQGRGELTESRVLDGDGYFLDGRLVVTVVGEDLCLHVGRDHWQAALAGDGVRPLLFADLPVPGWVIVEGTSVDAEETLARWIESALARG
jgi:hypothetical protein